MPDKDCPACGGTGVVFVEKDGEGGGWGGREAIACGGCRGTGRV